MTEYLESKTSGFFVKDLRNSQLLRVISALNLDILNLNLFNPGLFRASLGLTPYHDGDINAFYGVVRGGKPGEIRFMLVGEPRLAY